MSRKMTPAPSLVWGLFEEEPHLSLFTIAGSAGLHKQPVHQMKEPVDHNMVSLGTPAPPPHPAPESAGHTLHVCLLSCFICVCLFETLWTVACQAPLTMGFSRQEYWGGLPHPPPGDLPEPGIEFVPFTSPASADRFFTASTTWEVPGHNLLDYI